MRYTPAHALPAARRRRRVAVGVVAVVWLAGLPALTLPGSAVASVPECNLTPELSEVMVNQGLPSYKEFQGEHGPEHKLVRGKTTLVKYFLRLPGCAPDTASVRIVGGQLFTTISPAKVDASGKLVLPPASEVLAVTTPTGALPAAPVGPTATAPVPEAGSDPLFVVPGSALRPSSPEEKRVYFAAALQYTVNGGAVQTLNLLAVPVSGRLVSRVIDRDVRPMRVLVVPMGDAGTAEDDNDHLREFPNDARTELTRGMTALSRVLPVPDYQGEALSASNAGLRTGLSAGLLSLGQHEENGTRVNYMANGASYCGDLGHFNYIAGELQKRRTAHNSLNPGQQAEFAYGAIWQERSLGASTGTTSKTCIEGAGSVPGRAAWGRVIAPVEDVRAGLTGTLAAMELTHNAGQVRKLVDSRFKTGFHSVNAEADVSAVDRAWNTLERRWVPQDRSVMSDDFTGWNDSNALLEKEDWNAVHCLLTKDTCGTVPTIGVGAAGASSGTFYLAGSFSGYGDDQQGNEQADVASYHQKDGRAEPADAKSPYLFVQLAGESVLATDGIPVASSVDHHTGEAHEHRGADVFGVHLRAAQGVDRIRIYRGAVAPGNLIYERTQQDVPEIVSVSAANRTASISATADDPHDLRLDLFLACPEMVSPLVVDLHPLVVGKVAAFTTSYDTSLGCGDEGTLLYRLNNGFQTLTRTALTDAVGEVGVGGVAAIYAPTAGADITQYASIPLAGTGKDAAGLPADQLEWRLAPVGKPLPAEPTFVGDTGSIAAPDSGFAVSDHQVELRAFRSGVQFARVTSKVTVLPDRDRDLLPDPVEPPCFADSVTDPRNATRDSDSDGKADVVDVVDVNGDGLIDVLREYAPCTRRGTGDVSFDPQKLQKGSSGTPVTVRLSSREVDLVALKASGAQLFIHQIAGYPVSLPAQSWSVELTLTGPVASAKFSREAVNQVLNVNGVLGYAPVFVGTQDRRLYGADRTYPVVFP